MTAKQRNITTFQLDPANPPTLASAQAQRLEELPIDYSDIPELPDDFWTNHPPVARDTKEQLTIRVDKTVVEFFRTEGPGYQTRMNDVLRSYVEAMRQRKPLRVADTRERATGKFTQGPARKAAKASKPRENEKGHTRRSRGPQP
jgi:uncharacterized protein (DUF4415 family)